MSYSSTLPNVHLSFTSSCLGDSTSNTTICHGLKVGSEVVWTVTAELLSCPNATTLKGKHTIRIQPLGLQDHVMIDFQPICQCDCPANEEKKEEGTTEVACSGKGRKECGICLCDRNRLGKNCQCQKTEGFSDIEDINGCVM